MTESLETMGGSEESNETVPVFTDSDISTPSTPTDGTPTSILRNRKTSGK
jgi:hypothetical protein